MDGIPKIALQNADNPSPLVLPDASKPSGYRILLAFRFPGNDSFCGAPRCSPSVIGMAEAFSFEGPYEAYAPSYERAGEVLPFPPAWDGTQHGDGSEDPALFKGVNNTIHMLVHKYTTVHEHTRTDGQGTRPARLARLLFGRSALARVEAIGSQGRVHVRGGVEYR
jgi:hypothetical protein